MTVYGHLGMNRIWFAESDSEHWCPNEDWDVAVRTICGAGLGVDVELRSVSAALYRGAREAASWMKETFQVPGCSVTATDVVERRSRGNARALLWTGGVDSMHAALFCGPFDFLIHVHDPRELAALEHARRSADAIGLPLHVVRTNAKTIGDVSVPPNSPVLEWVMLCLVVGTFWRAIREVAVAATVAYPESLLVNYGSQPRVDALWSTEAVRATHVGAVPRQHKLNQLVASGAPVEEVTVCLRADGNCGRCEKCLRTAVGLLAAGSTRWPRGLKEPTVEQIDALTLGEPHMLLHWAETYRQLEASPLKTAIEGLFERSWFSLRHRYPHLRWWYYRE